VRSVLAMSLLPRPTTVTGAVSSRAFSSERRRFLRVARPRGRARSIWPAIERPCRQPPAPLAMMREQEVHVVAAEEDVVAHRHARMSSSEPAGLHRRDRGEVRRPAAEIDHQDHLAGLRTCVAPPGARRLLDPRVEGGLRLFEEHEHGPGLLRARPRTVSSRAPAIEGGGHGEHHVLLGEATAPRCAADPRRPARWARVAPRRLDGGDLLDVLRARSIGQRARAPVRRRSCGEPALGAAHEPRPGRRLSAGSARCSPTPIWRARLAPRQRQGVRRQLSAFGEVERRKGAARASRSTCPRRDALRDRGGPRGRSPSPSDRSGSTSAMAEWVVPRSMPMA
jgi:hypothetical protein